MKRSSLSDTQVLAIQAFVASKGRVADTKAVAKLQDELNSHARAGLVLGSVIRGLLLVGTGMGLGLLLHFPMINAIAAAFLVRLLIFGPDAWAHFHAKVLRGLDEKVTDEFLTNCPNDLSVYNGRTAPFGKC